MIEKDECNTDLNGFTLEEIEGLVENVEIAFKYFVSARQSNILFLTPVIRNNENLLATSIQRVLVGLEEQVNSIYKTGDQNTFGHATRLLCRIGGLLLEIENLSLVKSDPIAEGVKSFEELKKMIMKTQKELKNSVENGGLEGQLCYYAALCVYRKVILNMPDNAVLVSCKEANKLSEVFERADTQARGLITNSGFLPTSNDYSGYRMELLGLLSLPLIKTYAQKSLPQSSLPSKDSGSASSSKPSGGTTKPVNGPQNPRSVAGRVADRWKSLSRGKRAAVTAGALVTLGAGYQICKKYFAKEKKTSTAPVAPAFPPKNWLLLILCLLLGGLLIAGSFYRKKTRA